MSATHIRKNLFRHPTKEEKVQVDLVKNNHKNTLYHAFLKKMKTKRPSDKTS